MRNLIYFKYISFLVCIGLTKYSFAQETLYNFNINLKKGDKFVYEYVETKYKKNNNGHFLYVQYDTTYFVFDVALKTDSGSTVLNFKHYDYYNNGNAEFDDVNKNNLLRTENYQILLDKNGAFVQLLNWEDFAKILIQNLKISYSKREIDSNNLKYYYLYYHKELNVEKTVLSKLFELFKLYGESYKLGTSYNLSKEILNPFAGYDIVKPGKFEVSLTNSIKNSVFFKGSVKTDVNDLEKLKSDYYNYFINQNLITEVPNIYIIDQYEYQYGLINQIILKFVQVHDIYIDNETQGVEKKFALIDFKR